MIAVVGAGASGLMAAISAAEAGAEVLVVERNEKAGKKLYITGKGRCNVTNAAEGEDFFAHIRRNPRFLYSAFSAFSNRDLMAWLEGEGVPLVTERGGRVFPESMKASDVTRALERAARRRGVRFAFGARVRELIVEDGRCAGVRVEGDEGALDAARNAGFAGSPDAARSAGSPGARSVGSPDAARSAGSPGARSVGSPDAARSAGSPNPALREIRATAVILCTGGCSYPMTGSTGDGFALAAETGHAVAPPRASLVALETVERWPAELSGLTLKNVGLRATVKERQVFEETGEMLFTHFGVSGPLVLAASCEVADAEPRDVRLFINLKPARTVQELEERIARETAGSARKQMIHAVQPLFPGRLTAVALRLAGIDPELPAGQLSRAGRTALVEAIRALPLTLKATRPLDEAVITRGGVSVRDVDPRSMASKKLPGLYFAGELLDVDAQTGGYNLQIAFSTGRAAGLAAGAGD